MYRTRTESVGRKMARQQSTSEAPTMEFVSVAVLPPRLPQNLAPPTGIGASDAFGWDESVNWQHNEPIQEETPSKRKQFFRKAGLTTTRKRTDDDQPPFTFRQVPYDTWRKHYAKDKDGNYKGTHAPAEDCLLLPHDVEKWRIEPMKTKGDRWTRGSEALPVYAEVRESAPVPEYNVDYDGPPPEERTLSVADSQAESSAAPGPMPGRKTLADGKTASEIIEEAKRKNSQAPKTSFRTYMKKGFEMASMGSG